MVEIIMVEIIAGTRIMIPGPASTIAVTGRLPLNA
jgi:hypothetical protein